MRILISTVCLLVALSACVEAPAPRPELPQSSEESGAQRRPDTEEHLVLSELVMELMRHGVLPSVKCQAMLQKLNR